MTRGYSSKQGYSSPAISPLALLALVMMLVCFGIAAFYFLSQKQPSQTSTPVEDVLETGVVDVLVSVEKIEAGVPLEPILFRKETRPVIAVGPSRVTSFEQIKGGFSQSFIPAGQPLLSEYVTFKRPINQIQANIPDSFRAVSIAVDETTSVEGWARAGAKVDVLLISTVNGRSTATVIVQNARVLSGGGSEQEDEKGRRKAAVTVTLMVTIDEATKIQLASSAGVLSLVLRGDEDTIEAPSNSSISIDSLLGQDNVKPAEIPAEGRIKIDGREFLIVRGKLVPHNQVK